jgi:hypothetical protein
LNARGLRDESGHGFRFRHPEVRERGISRLQQI